MDTSDLTIAVVTWNNRDQLIATLQSLVSNTRSFAGRLLVINNGQDEYGDIQSQIPREFDWIDAGENLGWMGGINLALQHTTTKYFAMLNDDVFFIQSQPSFWEDLLSWFNDPTVGGVGPYSNYASGFQNMWQMFTSPGLEAPLLIGFCAVYRTALLKNGLDESLPGGDDYDLSIRVIDSGFRLIVDRRAFLYHIGAQTGTRLHPGYWDSQQHQAKTYNAIIRKHGLKRWYQSVNDRPRPLEVPA